MIDASKVKYDLAIITPTGEKFFLTEFIHGGVLEENNGELAARLEVKLQNKLLPTGKFVCNLTPLGGKVFLYANWGVGWQEVFRGTIFLWDYINDGNPHYTITAYDDLYYLIKSEDDRFYKSGTTAKAIIQDIAGAWGIPLGAVEGPNAPLAKQVFRGETLADMITKVVDQSRKQGSGKWVVRSKQGKINVIRPGQNTPVYHFGAYDTAIQASDQHSIEQLVTRVRVMGAENKDARTGVVATLDGKTEFGILQRLIYSQQYDNVAAAKAAAQELLNEDGKPKKIRKVTAVDLPSLRKGDKVHVAAGTLLGHFIVAGVVHDIKTGTMVMEVEDVG